MTSLGAAPALVSALVLAFPAGGATVRFRAESLADGGAIPAHASASGDPSDAAAARRRSEIVRSPYYAVDEERALRSDARIAFDRGVPRDVRDKLAAGAAAALAALDRDGWARVGSARTPLQLLVTAQRSDLSAAGWEGRERGLLVRPIAVVPAGEGERAALLHLARQAALLSLRQSAPEAPAWAVEGAAEFLGRHALALDGDPVPADDPLLADSGTLAEPAALAEYLPLLARRLPRGAGELRAAWEEASSRSEDAEALLRELSLRADARGVAGLLGDLLVRRLSRTAVDDPLPGGRRPFAAGALAAAAPPPLGWRRVTLRTAGEAGGIEVLLPQESRVAAGRALVGYRGEADGFDAVDVLPGVPRRLPLSGIARLGIVLVDGEEAGDLFVELTRLPDYPAALSGSSAEWSDGAAHLAWSTDSHRDLLAWVVSRVDETDGEGLPPERFLVPTSESDDGGFHYRLDDPDARPGHRYRYRVFALTTEGVLSEAFGAAVAAGR